MGYSHYHIQKRTFTESEWSAIQDAATAMIAAWPLVRGPLSVRVDESIISFNGIGVGEHETFILERQLPAIDECGRMLRKVAKQSGDAEMTRLYGGGAGQKRVLAILQQAVTASVDQSIVSRSIPWFSAAGMLCIQYSTP